MQMFLILFFVRKNDFWTQNFQKSQRDESSCLININLESIVFFGQKTNAKYCNESVILIRYYLDLGSVQGFCGISMQGHTLFGRKQKINKKSNLLIKQIRVLIHSQMLRQSFVLDFLIQNFHLLFSLINRLLRKKATLVHFRQQQKKKPFDVKILINFNKF